MKDRLTHAYDRMAMPEDSARRVEQAMLRKLEQKDTRGRQVRIVKSPPKGRPWGSVAACLALLLTLGGGALVLGWVPKPSGLNTPPQSLAAPTEPWEVELTQEGANFLRTMCYSMPDGWDFDKWMDSDWTQFIFRSFTSPDPAPDGTYQTLAGPVELTEDGSKVRVSQHAVKDYVQLALGRELPEFSLDVTGNYWPVERDGEDFLVGVSDFGSQEFVFDGSERREPDGTPYLDVRFKTLEGNYSVVFRLKAADNANGFVITRKITNEVLGTLYNGEYAHETTGETAVRLRDMGDGTIYMELTLDEVGTLDCVGISIGNGLYFSILTEGPWEFPIYGTFSPYDDGRKGELVINSLDRTGEQIICDFVRTQDQTDLEMPEAAPGSIWEKVDESLQNMTIQMFAGAYRRGDWTDMARYAVPELELKSFIDENPDMASRNLMGMDAGLRESDPQDTDGGPVGYALFQEILSSGTWEAYMEVPVWELTMELDKRANGWKISGYDCALAGDRGRCLVVAQEFFRAWTSGELRIMNALSSVPLEKEEVDASFPGYREKTGIESRGPELVSVPDGTWDATVRFSILPDTSTWILTMKLEKLDGDWKVRSYNVFQ